MADTLIIRTARERHRALVRSVIGDLRRIRLDRGISQRALAEAAGLHPSVVSRIEAERRSPSLAAIVAMATALGTEASLRLFQAVGPRIHDRTQARILDALLDVASPRWHARLEVAVTRPARGVIDAVLSDRRGSDVVATEVQGQLRTVEAQLRWAGQKADSLPSAVGWPWSAGASPRTHRLLVLRSTAATRAAARDLHEVFAAAYPAPEEDAWRALTDDETPWPGDALLWADADRPVARILQGPPRGTGR